MAADVAYLASAALQGRAVGSGGGDLAALFIANRYDELGLAGAFASCSSPPSCASSHVQIFTADRSRAENVVALIPGADPLLRSHYVIVGAHYDHLGYSTRGALDPERGEVLRPGADDNASGTAAVLELARRLALEPAASTVLLAHFDAEEMGMLGSRAFVAVPPVPLDSVALMINLDMVGRLRGGRLRVEVTPPAAEFRDAIVSLASELDVPLQFSRLAEGRSDHSTFSDLGIASILLHTGFHPDYHRMGDIPERVDPTGILRITDLAERLVRTAHLP